MKVQIEYTDTFCGEANYSWCHRTTLTFRHNATKRTILRKAKSHMGLKGWRGKLEDWGDMLVFKPWRSCTILFVTYSVEE